MTWCLSSSIFTDMANFFSQRFVALKSNTKQKSEILTRIDTSGRPSPIHPACLPPESPPQPSAATIIFSCHHQQQSRERRWLDDVPSERALRGRWLVTKWKGLNLLVCLFCFTETLPMSGVQLRLWSLPLRPLRSSCYLCTRFHYVRYTDVMCFIGRWAEFVQLIGCFVWQVCSQAHR